MTSVLFGDAQLNRIFLVQVLGTNARNIGHEEIDSSGMNRNEHVLVDVAKLTVKELEAIGRA